MNEEYDKENPFGLELDSNYHNTRRDFTGKLILQFVGERDSCYFLDVGCGKGIITKYVRSILPNAKIDAIDISEKAIQFAMEDSRGINFYVSDAKTYEGMGYKYDIIILNNIYEHVENPFSILRNLQELLKENGAMIISTPNRFSAKNIIKAILGFKIEIPKYHVTEYSIGQIYDHHSYIGLEISGIFFPKYRRDEVRYIDLADYLFQWIFNCYLKIIKSKIRVNGMVFYVSRKRSK